MTDLEPCPFCGGEAEQFTEEYGQTSPLVSGHGLQVYSRSTCFGVRCRRCDVGHTNPYVTSDYAIAAWNTRAPSSAARERDGLREAMPDLTAVIAWLQRGCDPVHAITELAIYQGRIERTLNTGDQS